jgi:thioredoxin-dependent peroxiredoxin
LLILGLLSVFKLIRHDPKRELPYPLISDPKRLLISALGAGEGGKTQRSHFIFGKGGKLLDKKNPVQAADR